MSAHHDEQQELEKAKHLWRRGGKWVFALLVAAALAYLGNSMYQSPLRGKNEEAATEGMKVQGDYAKLTELQNRFKDSPAAAQSSLQTALALFNAGKLDEAAKAYQWVLDTQKEPVLQVSAAQNLANVLVEQKKFDDALKVLNLTVPAEFEPLLNESKGDVLAAQGKKQEAAAAYKAALDKLPEDSLSRELVEAKLSQ